MAVYRDGKLVVGQATIITDDITLEGDGSADNRVRIKRAGVGREQIAETAVGSAQLDENVVSLKNLAHGTAGQTIVFDADGAPAEGYRSNPYAIWWGLNQTSRIAPQRAFGIDYNNTAILRFNGTNPDEHGFGGDALGTIMQTQPLGTAITNNIDRNYAGEPSANFTLDDNEFFQLPAGVWRLRCHAETTGQGFGAGHIDLMQVATGLDDRKMAYTPGWQSDALLTDFDGTTFDLIVPHFTTLGTEVFYLRLRKSTLSNENYSYFLLLEKLQ